MRCDDIRERIADRLDELLDAPDALAVDEHIADCAACTDHAREVRALREMLYEKDETGLPPPELVGRIRVAVARRTPGQRFLALARYAAVFLAGAGAAFAFRPDPEVVTVPAEPVVSRVSPPGETPVVKLDTPRVPRRIR